MIKKWLAIFVIFFLGTSALITVDHICKESTGAGGRTGLSITQTADGDVDVSFFGMEWKVER